MPELIHPELSYTTRGILLQVYNTLGPMLPEKYYQDAVVLSAEKRGLTCEAEKAFEVFYRDERVGLYFVDVWVENGKILLELKVSPAIEPIHKAQAISYLKVTDADLAIVVNFGAASLEDERLPNFLHDKQPEFVWESRSIPPTCSILISSMPSNAPVTGSISRWEQDSYIRSIEGQR